MTFLRFATAIRGWMKTFGREMDSPTMRASPYPCRRIIKKPEDGDDLCKYKDKFHDSEGNDISEEDSCTEMTQLWEHEEFVTGSHDKQDDADKHIDHAHTD